MATYALKIRKSDLPLLTFLNGGVEPQLEKSTTYLVFSTEPNDISTQIVKERDLAEFGDISRRGPVLFRFNQSS